MRNETGVEVTALDELGAADVVMLDVAPAAAVRLAGARMPARVARALQRFRHGPGAFKVDYAVEGGVPLRHEPSRSAGTVHVAGGAAELAAAEREVTRGQMPERPYVLVCQQSLADPSRARDGVHPLYAYAHVPIGWTGDATALVDAQIERFAPGFGDRVLARHVRSAVDMAAYDVNYVGGDIVTGANDPRQMLLRPRPALDPYATGDPRASASARRRPRRAPARTACAASTRQPPRSGSSPGASLAGMREVPIRGDMIRLGQLLKLAGLVGSGGEAKELLATGAVSVNGEAEERRGRQLRRGDVVAAGTEELRVT